MAQKPTVYAFIDSQNLNLGVRSSGWHVDYQKLRLYLKNKYRVSKAFVFIGHIENNQELYETLQQAGFILIFKPTVRYIENGKETVKGNVDAELVLHAAAIEYPHYDKAVIISGDGDFSCLIDYLVRQDKLLHIIAPNPHYSTLLRKFSPYIVRIDSFKKSVMQQKDRHRRSVETLGLSGHDDVKILPD